MDGIIFDLRNFRATYLNGMSQEEFAKQVGITQDKVSRMEADPTQISLEIIVKIATHFGMSLDELINLPGHSAQAVSVDYTWSSVEFVRQTMLEYIAENGVDAAYSKDIDELQTLLKKTLRKPKIVLVGRSDVGKSTMINTLLGTTRLPAHWTPATAIAVYVKHVNDRPAYMENDDVWVFCSDDATNDVWDDTRLDDEEYCRSLKLASGNYDLLNTYGTRKGEHFEESNATAAVVFIDSSLLLNCDLIDLPGYGTGDRQEDDALSLREKNKADVLVYLSIANGFMRSEDIAYIKDAIHTLSDAPTDAEGNRQPLSNLFIVASQAHVIDHSGDLEDILASGCERFESTLSEDFWNNREKPDSLLDRFYTYTSNSQALRERFVTDFVKLIESLPQAVEDTARNVIQTWVADKDAALQKVICGYQQLLDDRKQCEELLKTYTKNEPKRHVAFQKSKQKISENIARYKKESSDEVTQYYHDTITVEHLTALMEKRGVRKRKGELQDFCAYVSGLLQDKTSGIIKEKSQDLSTDIENFLADFDNSAVISENDDSAFFVSPFNKTQAFAAGLAGMATYGALAFWAASCGNLGGYILVAKGVSLLSSLGISVGGTAAAASAVASIGGPVVLGIALALIAAFGVFAAFSGTWRRSVAKKMVESFRNERVLDKLLTNITTYWNDTQTAFNASADNLNNEWKKHLDSLREQLRTYDIEKITKAKEDAEAMRNFLQCIPL